MTTGPMPPQDDWEIVASGDPQLMREIEDHQDQNVYCVRVTMQIGRRRAGRPSMTAAEPAEVTQMLIPEEYVRHWYPAERRPRRRGSEEQTQITLLTEIAAPDYILDLWQENQHYHDNLKARAGSDSPQG